MCKIWKSIPLFQIYIDLYSFLSLVICTPLIKVVDWNSIRVNQSYSEPIRKMFCISFGEKWLKINPTWPVSFRLNPMHQFEWILIKFSIRTRIDSNRMFNSTHPGPGLNWIKSDWILIVFHQTRYKTFFWLVRNDPECFGNKFWNVSNWIPFRNFRHSFVFPELFNFVWIEWLVSMILHIRLQNQTSHYDGCLSKALKSLWYDCSKKEDPVDQRVFNNVRDAVAESWTGGSCTHWIATGTIIVWNVNPVDLFSGILEILVTLKITWSSAKPTIQGKNLHFKILFLF